MSNGDGATTRGPRVGVVAPTALPDLLAAIEAAGGDVTVDDAASVVAADPDLVVAVGDAAMAALARAAVAAPVLAVAVSGVPCVERSAAPAAIERVLTDSFGIRERPVLGVSTPDHDARAVADAGLVSATPATISEFSMVIEHDSTPRARSSEHPDGSPERPGTSPENSEATETSSRSECFRADGVVVATPAGSEGYSRAAGGPTLAAGTGVVSVVPIAPFALDPGHWVCRPEALSITVERDETAVELRADDRTVGTVEPGAPVRFDVAGHVTVAVPID